MLENHVTELRKRFNFTYWKSANCSVSRNELWRKMAESFTCITGV